jgi:hypothetical protein
MVGNVNVQNTTNKQIADTIENAVADASNRGIPEWMAATDDLVELLVENGECFSSGEVASFLRTFCPQLRFSVTSNVGEHLRDRFYACSMPLYNNADGSTSPVEQASRTTAGFTRTPPNTSVFVYGTDHTAIQAHEFEVEIPKPGFQTPADPTDQYGLPAKPVQAPTPVQKHFVQLAARPPAKDLTATVHNDSRIRIGRSVFEAFLHATGASLSGGSTVYIKVDDVAEQAVVTLDRQPGSQGYQLAASRGRVLFPHPVTPFTPGDTYSVTISGNELVVDLSAKL